jgi:flagellar hook-associated protein 2
MDIKSIVDEMVKIRATRITTAQDKAEGINADVAAWVDVGKSVQALTDAAYDLRNLSTWNRMSVTSSDEDVVTAVAGTDADAATYAIVVDDLAQAHSVASDSLASAASPLVGMGLGINVNDEFVFKDAGGSVIGTIRIEAADTLNTLRNKINTAAASMDEEDRVYASILDNRLVVTRELTGDTDIRMENSTGTPLQQLGILNGGGAWKNQLVASQDASFTVNGAIVTRSSNSDLDDVIGGVTLALTGEGTGVTLRVGHDTETPRNAIDAFVAAYNAAVTKLESYNEIDLSDPDNPATGELQGDTMVGSLLSNLRKLATASKSPYLNSGNASYTYGGSAGVADSIEDIGVWTSGKENSLSVVDEDRLKYMLDNEFEKVEQVFRGVYDVQEGYQHGVAEDLYDYLYGTTATLTGSIDKRVTTLEGQAADLQDQIDTWFDELELYEQSLWEQFGAMDEAMGKAKQQMSWLSAQFNS